MRNLQLRVDVVKFKSFLRAAPNTSLVCKELCSPACHPLSLVVPQVRFALFRDSHYDTLCISLLYVLYLHKSPRRDLHPHVLSDTNV